MKFLPSESKCRCFGFVKKVDSVVRASLKEWSLQYSLIVSLFGSSLRNQSIQTAKPVTCIGLGLGIMMDIAISVSMVWILYHKKTGFQKRVQFLLI